jgi:HK97 gp10 family phage protein
MIELDTKLSGDFTSGLDKLEAKVRGEVLLSGVAAMAKVIYDEVLSNTSPPRMGRVTGTLHDSVYRAFSPERSTQETKIYHVSVNKRKAPHWHLLEYGTSRMSARPYLRPALSRMGDAVDAGMKRLKDRLR